MTQDETTTPDGQDVPEFPQPEQKPETEVLPPGEPPTADPYSDVSAS
jgi:hypothetical protein